MEYILYHLSNILKQPIIYKLHLILEYLLINNIPFKYILNIKTYSNYSTYIW